MPVGFHHITLNVTDLARPVIVKAKAANLTGLGQRQASAGET